MFSKEESRKIRQEFWTSFGKSFPKKWLLYNTKIKDMSFKFSFDRKKAFVSLDIEDDRLEKRIELWEKINSLKTILTRDFINDLVFDDSFILENGKEISRVYIVLHNVSVHNKNTWQETMEFFNKNMTLFEAFFWEYEDFLKS
ncbi:DUF4268 domain-containing protein [Spongiivirga citrea]|uniref:DUF4268 domain-containing protein n=1 Tax=Spongiivirga citrea TaxID=1481457 RepID=A0A6M0CEN5_9FLAO|nr:DUF4268 domain-containing protein [Spongiivirga citrea]NER16288.1 DUF4268 domain-containing protein [Spongiivirga citrea]